MKRITSAYLLVTLSCASDPSVCGDGVRMLKAFDPCTSLAQCELPTSCGDGFCSPECETDLDCVLHGALAFEEANKVGGLCDRDKAACHFFCKRDSDCPAISDIVCKWDEVEGIGLCSVEDLCE